MAPKIIAISVLTCPGVRSLAAPVVEGIIAEALVVDDLTLVDGVEEATDPEDLITQHSPGTCCSSTI